MAIEHRSHSDYTVGWVCALPKELIAAAAMLDETHEGLPRQPNDHNYYTLGRVGVHNVAIACLPKGEIGTENAAVVATRMVSTFPCIKFGLMVGIGAGVPRTVRLGDVVVSTPTDEFGGVVQWDYGKAQEGGFKRTGSLNRPPAELLSALTSIEKEHMMKGSKIPTFLRNLETNWPKLVPKYIRSERLKDVLFKVDCEHITNMDTNDNDEMEEDDEEQERNDCIHCDQTKIVRRKPRDMRIHYGLIASGNQVIKNAKVRDDVNKRLGGKVLCFEMEAAGLMNDFPCLVIRGICDYADAHKNKDWQEHAAAVAAAFAKELLLLVHAQEVEQMHSIKQLQSRLEEVSIAVSDIRFHQQDHQRNQVYQTIIDWLTPVNYATDQSLFITQHRQGTGEWFLRSCKFRHWLKQANWTLFSPGMPGAGKTIITSIVVKHILDQFHDDPSVSIAYMYCDSRRQHEQRALDLMINLLKQLVMKQSSVPAAVKDLHDKHKKKQSRPLLDEIRRVIHQVMHAYSRTFIVIDALDECGATQDGRDLFLQEIFNLQASFQVNIFVTSRYIPEIEVQFDRACKLEIRADETDVQQYLHFMIQNTRFLKSRKDTLQVEIKNRIAKAVHGMFLLARLYINSLASKTTDKAIKEALRELETKPGSSDDEKKSKALDDAYEEILQRIEEQGHERCQLAKQVLTWISCSKRRLTCSELQHAIAIEEGTSELDPDNLTDITLMPSVCAGLVIIDERSGVIRLIHHTAEEYFDRTWKHWFPDAQTDMAEACTTYLSFGAFESGCCQTLTSLEERFKFYAFYQYASQNWGHHASKSFIEGERPMLDFLRNDTKVSACAQAMEYRSKEFFDYQHGTKTTGLHLAAYFGLWKSTSNLLESNAEVETKDHYERSPLLYAAEKGHERVVKRLLDGYANVNSTDRFGNFPLLSAAENGHDAVVKLLLEANADLSLRDWWGSSPLLSAVYNGHTAVVKVLLDSDVYADSKDNEGTTPLIIAANHGHEAVVRMLLDNDAFVDSRDDNGQTPLSYAAQNGHEAVVRSLLEMNSDIESKDEHGRTPLSHAAEKGHKTVVKLLLDNNAVIASRDNKGRTPFLYAVHRKHEETVDLLLETTAHREPEYLMTYEELIDNLQNMDADSVSEREGGSRFEDYSEGDAATTGPLARAITL